MERGDHGEGEGDATWMKGPLPSHVTRADRNGELLCGVGELRVLHAVLLVRLAVHVDPAWKSGALEW